MKNVAITKYNLIFAELKIIFLTSTYIIIHFN